jgi:hypothetical protein
MMLDLTRARVAYTKKAIYIGHPELQPHVIELTNYNTLKIKVLAKATLREEHIINGINTINVESPNNI